MKNLIYIPFGMFGFISIAHGKSYDQFASSENIDRNAPAQAASGISDRHIKTIPFNLHNNSESTYQIKLSGDIIYAFTISRVEKRIINIKEGKYDIQILPVDSCANHMIMISGLSPVFGSNVMFHEVSIRSAGAANISQFD